MDYALRDCRKQERLLFKSQKQTKKTEKKESNWGWLKMSSHIFMSDCRKVKEWPSQISQHFVWNNSACHDSCVKLTHILLYHSWTPDSWFNKCLNCDDFTWFSLTSAAHFQPLCLQWCGDVAWRKSGRNIISIHPVTLTSCR